MLMRRWLMRLLPGVLLSAAVWWIARIAELGGAVIVSGGDAVYALRRTGLAGFEDAAGACMKAEVWSRDGHEIRVFKVKYRDDREAMFRQMTAENGWTRAQISAEEYMELAEAYFYDPADIIQPPAGVVFDAFHYEDKFWKRNGQAMNEGRWALPDGFGMDMIPYATDFVFAFFDVESGAFYFCEQSC